MSMNFMHKTLVKTEGKYYSRNTINILVYTVDCCNYNCYYCYNVFPRTKQKLNLDYLHKYLQFIHANAPKKSIDLEFIGGEPTLHPQLIEFCNKIKHDKYIRTNIYTNMSADINTYIQLLQSNVTLIASWHGTNEDHCNQHYIDMVIDLVNLGFKDQLDIRIMYEPNNTDNSILAFNRIKNIIPHNKIEMSLLVQSNVIKADNSELYVYTNDQLSRFHECVDDLNKSDEKKEYVLTFSDGSIEYKCFNDLFGYNQYSYKHFLCDAKMCNLYIHCDGNIYPCVDYFTFNKQPLFSIYQTSHFKVFNAPIICQLDYCSCDWSIRKQKVFKHQ